MVPRYPLGGSRLWALFGQVGQGLDGRGGEGEGFLWEPLWVELLLGCGGFRRRSRLGDFLRVVVF